MNIVLLDTSYIFKKVCSTEVWCKHAEKVYNHDTIYENFLSSLNKLSKNLKVSINDMILCRDTANIWRKEYYPKYKEKRGYSGYGPYIKELYKRIEKLFHISLRIDGAEGDDIISILTFYFLQNRGNHIYIISDDKDFFQLPSLMKSSRIHILSVSTFKEYTDDFSLHEKIIKGDASDNVKKLKKNYTYREYLLNKQMIDLSYTPRWIQDEIFKSGYFENLPYCKPLDIQLGFACINTDLREKSVFCSRVARLKTVQDKGLGYLKDLVRENIKDLKHLIRWNFENGIRFMRMSSEMMPHFANPRLKKLEGIKAEDYTFDFIKKDLEEVGRLARLYKQRLTFHPGQFNILSTPSEDVFQNTYGDLKWHADFMDVCGLDQDNVMVIHGGGVYGDKKSALERFIKNFNRLPENVQRRLVIENCEKCYNVEDVLYISDITGCPVIFDTHHFDCYKKLKRMGKRRS